MNKLTVIIGLMLVVIVGAAALLLLPANQAFAPTGDKEEQTNEDTGNASEVADRIVASFPEPGDTISSPLVATGKARGTWFFEASFPVTVLDAQGNEIGQGYAQAQGEWMTTEFVPFQSIAVTFTAQPAGSTGTVVLHKDNPSGLPEHDAELRIPVVF